MKTNTIGNFESYETTASQERQLPWEDYLREQMERDTPGYFGSVEDRLEALQDERRKPDGNIIRAMLEYLELEEDEEIEKEMRTWWEYCHGGQPLEEYNRALYERLLLQEEYLREIKREEGQARKELMKDRGTRAMGKTPKYVEKHGGLIARKKEGNSKGMRPDRYERPDLDHPSKTREADEEMLMQQESVEAMENPEDYADAPRPTEYKPNPRYEEEPAIYTDGAGPDVKHEIRSWRKGVSEIPKGKLPDNGEEDRQKERVFSIGSDVSDGSPEKPEPDYRYAGGGPNHPRPIS